jgi:hypothetical protein
MGKPKLPKLWIEYEVKDKDGKLLDKGKIKSQSWVGNIIALISCLFNIWGTGVSSYVSTASRSDLIDTSNTARPLRIAVSSATIAMGGNAPAGETTAGIVVGSSNTPVAIDQYSLQALIAHGTGAGQLQYGATTVDPIVKTATTWTLRIIRTFTNGSGATVTVYELGLYLKVCFDGQTIMLARDVPATPITVPDASTLTLRYIISHTV